MTTVTKSNKPTIEIQFNPQKYKVGELARFNKKFVLILGYKPDANIRLTNRTRPDKNGIVHIRATNIYECLLGDKVTYVIEELLDD